MKVSQLPTAKMAPKTLLVQMLDDVEDIESVVIVKVDKEGCAQAFSSNLPLSTLCFASKALDRYVLGRLEESTEDEID